MTIGPQLGQGCTPEHLVWQFAQANTLPDGKPEDSSKPSLCVQLEYNFCTGIPERPEYRFELNWNGYFPGLPPLSETAPPGLRRFLIVQGDMQNPDGFLDVQFVVAGAGGHHITTPSDTVNTGRRLHSVFPDGRTVMEKAMVKEVHADIVFANKFVWRAGKDGGGIDADNVDPTKELLTFRGGLLVARTPKPK